MKTFFKTRIAPTPSGFLHLGNALSFWITEALATKHNARLLLRIDDMDRERVDPAFIDDIFETLDFLDIQWDEGPRNPMDFEANYSQVHRMDLYRRALQKLVDSGMVYACTCSRKQIENEFGGRYPGTCRFKKIPLDTRGAAWRLDTDRAADVLVKNPDGIITQTPFPDVMNQFVVRKKDGFPAYQLTSVVDDLHFGIDLIVRGADLWPSTLAQLFLAKCLGESRFLDVAFYHHPLLLLPDGTKLSKSAGATSIRHLRQTGHSRQDLLTELGRLLDKSVTAPTDLF